MSDKEIAETMLEADKTNFAASLKGFAAFVRSNAFDFEDREMVAKKFEKAAEIFAEIDRREKAQGWQGIESAPRDGRKFLTWDNYYGIRIGLCFVRPTHDDWLSYCDAFGGSSKGGMRATHWQPLPAPPTPATESQP